MKVIELFAGIGSQHQALKNLHIEHEVVAISEIDKYAVQSYTALHGQPNNLGDITKIQELPNADLWTYSFPCQGISVAGKQAGNGIVVNVLEAIFRQLFLTETKEHEINSAEYAVNNQMRFL